MADTSPATDTPQIPDNYPVAEIPPYLTPLYLTLPCDWYSLELDTPMCFDTPLLTLFCSWHYPWTHGSQEADHFTVLIVWENPNTSSHEQWETGREQEAGGETDTNHSYFYKTFTLLSNFKQGWGRARPEAHVFVPCCLFFESNKNILRKELFAGSILSW